MTNIYRNEEPLPYQYLTNPDISNPIDLAQESCCFENQDLIPSHNLELDQYSTFDRLASYHFNEIELEYECYLDHQLCDSIPIFEYMLTPVSLPDLNQFLS